MRRAELTAWSLGLAGLFGSALCWAFLPLQFHLAWTAMLFVWLGWPLGSLCLLLVHALTGGRWGEALRPALLAGLCTLPLLLPALVPFLLGMSHLYRWMDPAVARTLSNQYYLNPGFFAWRGGIYLAVWLGLGGLALLLQRRGGAGLARLAGPGLFLLAITVTFAAVDMTLSIDPEFSSSIYGMITAAEFGLFALCIGVLATAPLVSREVLADLAKMMLAGVLLWTYLEFMQLLIVWNSDLAKETPFYIARSRHGWQVACWLLALFHFLLPFLMLLSPRLQRRPGAVMFLAVLLIAGSVLRGWWLMLPYGPRGIGPSDIAALCAIGGLAAGLAMRSFRLLPEARHVRA